MDEFNYEKDKFESQDPMFWDKYAKKYASWDEMYDTVYSGDERYPDWFNGGKLNLCNNILDIHMNDEKQKNRIAFIHECPILGICNKITYLELWNKVCIFSRVLNNIGIKKGDGVMIYMPNYIENVISILSCARLGAIYSCVFEGFSELNLSLRIDFFKPKLIITSNFVVKGKEIIHLIPTIKNALNLSNFKPENIIIDKRINNNESHDQDNTIPNSLIWSELMNSNNLNPLIEYVKVESNHGISLNFTSGTTGIPKGYQTSVAGFLIMSKYQLFNICGCKSGDIIFSSFEIGWGIGVTINVLSPLMIGMTSILFEGDTSQPVNTYFKIIEKYKINYLFTLPTELKIFKKSDPNAESIQNLDISSLKLIICIGEILDSSLTEFVNSKLNKTIHSNYGQSESGWYSIAPILNQVPYKIKTVGKPVPGYNIFIVSSSNDNNDIIKFNSSNEIGDLVIKLPLPPCYINTLYNDEGDKVYFNKYLQQYNGYYCTGDLAYKDDDGYIQIVSRSDDAIKIRAEKVYCSSCEEIILKHPLISDCVVFGIKDNEWVERVMGLIILKNTNNNNNDDISILKIQNEINERIEIEINSISKLKYLIQVSSIPSTKSGKMIRHVLSKIFNGENYQIPITIKSIDDFKKIEFEINKFKKLIE